MCATVKRTPPTGYIGDGGVQRGPRQADRSVMTIPALLYGRRGLPK
eukprot:IDg2574t1